MFIQRRPPQSFAEFERELIVERVKAGLERARSLGKKLGRPEKNPAAIARIVKIINLKVFSSLN